MKFNYLVKHNGVYYPSGTDVPMEEKPTTTKKVVGDSLGKGTKKYNEENLPTNMMSLRSLAKKEGLSFSNVTKMKELKAMLLEIEG